MEFPLPDDRFRADDWRTDSLHESGRVIGEWLVQVDCGMQLVIEASYGVALEHRIGAWKPNAQSRRGLRDGTVEIPPGQSPYRLDTLRTRSSPGQVIDENVNASPQPGKPGPLVRRSDVVGKAVDVQQARRRQGD